MARKFENSKNAKNSQRNKGTGNIIVSREKQTHVVWLVVGSSYFFLDLILNLESSKFELKV